MGVVLEQVLPRGRWRLVAGGVVLAGLVLEASAARAQQAAGPAPSPAAPGPPASTPITLTPSAYAAGLVYGNHPFRHRGFEGQVRLDVTRGLEWNAHASYTGDAFVDDATSVLITRVLPRPGPGFPPPPFPPGGLTQANQVTTTTVTAAHDVSLGGWLTPSADVPVWFGVEGHGLVADGSYGTGAALFGYVGVGVGDARFELGSGATWLEADTGITASARASYRVTPWLELSLLGLATRNEPRPVELGAGATRFSGGAEARFGPLEGFRAELRCLAGERALAIDRLGGVVENAPDVVRLSVSALLGYEVTKVVFLYVGGGYRQARFPGSEGYRAGSAFAGCEITF